MNSSLLKYIVNILGSIVFGLSIWGFTYKHIEENTFVVIFMLYLILLKIPEK